MTDNSRKKDNRNCRQHNSKDTGKNHPTTHELLTHFYEAVNTDDRLRKQWNCTHLSTLYAGAENTIPPEYAAVMILERKYWASGDQLRLDKVIDAIEKTVSLDEDKHQRLSRIKASFCNQWIKPKDNKNTHQHVKTRSGNKNGLPQSDRYPADLAVDLLYGSLLHGDYGKWIASRSIPLTTIIAIGTAIPRLDHQVHDVYFVLDAAIKNQSFKPNTTRIKQDTPAVSRVVLR